MLKRIRRSILLGVCATAWCCAVFRGTERAPAPGDERRTAACESEEGLSGSLRIVGSTSMEKLTEALSERFMEKYPGVEVSVEYTGSGAGIAAVLEGAADIGNSSRGLRKEERLSGAVENIVAIGGVAVCVDPGNRVTGLTMGRLAEIYTGKITNWSELGGADIPVVVVGREAGSGIRDVFERLSGAGNDCAYANELGSNGAVKVKVASTPGAIGYVSMDGMNGSVAALALNGVEASPENIRDGSYCLSVPLVMVTKGKISEQNELVRAWFDFVFSTEGKEIAEQAGLIAPVQSTLGGRRRGWMRCRRQDWLQVYIKERKKNGLQA